MIVIYSTGPLENAIGISKPGASSTVWVKVLNNNRECKTNVEVKVFKLDGHKQEVFCKPLTINPLASGFVFADVSMLDEFEVRIIVKNEPANVLVSVFGKDCEGRLVAAHRLVHSELKLIKKIFD